MHRTIIVTDLTRFKRPHEVCTAGIDRKNGECIRPMPYLQTTQCTELNILPGAILSGEFTVSGTRSGPHQEDYQHTDLQFHGPCTTYEFKKALEFGLFGGVEEGFEAVLKKYQKHIPADCLCKRSIITVKSSPSEIEVVEDSYQPGKIRLNFRDQSGHEFKDISITDLGFYNHARKHHDWNDLIALNKWLHLQDEVLLRLGLSRRFQSSDGRDGYWLQANGIYTFPDFHKDIRSYS